MAIAGGAGGTGGCDDVEGAAGGTRSGGSVLIAGLLRGGLRLLLLAEESESEVEGFRAGFLTGGDEDPEEDDRDFLRRDE